MALVKEYFDLTQKYKNDYGENTILLMMVGSFFEVYGLKRKDKEPFIYNSSILDFSRICELNVVEKNICAGSESVVMAGFKDVAIEKYIKKIQDAGFTAVVYVQKALPNGSFTRECGGIFSPGTYFQTESAALSNNLCCVWIHMIPENFLFKEKQIVVGIANVDIYTGETSIFQYKDRYLLSPTTFDELERFISIHKPSEAVVVTNLPIKDITNIIQYTGLQQCKALHSVYLQEEGEECSKKSRLFIEAQNSEKQIYQKEVFQKFYSGPDGFDYDTFMEHFYENDIAAQAFCFLLNFVFQHNPSLTQKIKVPVFENCSHRLILANHSLKQLNIIDDGNEYSGKYSSVLKMLNECLTPMGRREFSHRLLNPTATLTETLNQEYEITDYVLQILKKDEHFAIEMRKQLSQIKDLMKWGRLILLRKFPPSGFCRLFDSLKAVFALLQFIKSDATIFAFLKTKVPLASQTEAFCSELLQTISNFFHRELAENEDSLQNFETNFIKLKFSDALDTKTNELNESEAKLEAIRKFLNDMIPADRGSFSELVKLHETEKNNYSLICTSRRCKLLEERLPKDPTVKELIGYQGKPFLFTCHKNKFEYLKQSASNNCIVDDQIHALCKTIATDKVELKSIVSDCFQMFVEIFEAELFPTGKLDAIVQIVTAMDVLFTKANLAKKYGYCRPQIVTSAPKSFFQATGMRHCLIEHIQQQEIYVANDLCLGQQENIDGILLYGTNAVGKTSFIRAIGICIIMAQAGLFVPCASFIYKPYKYIFTRIIGNDNLFKGLSTFAVEMLELRTILQLADENSLILGDELCSGTESVSAISIFVAGIQWLREKQSSFIFATHLHEIVNYEEILALKSVVMRHMAVQYNRELGVLVYDRKLREGPGDNMYGLEVCKSLNLPAVFLENANQIRMKYNPESASLLEKKVSHFNAKKVVNMCEHCGVEMGTEVHHLEEQATANEDGLILREDGSILHKNHAANLMTLCEKCHLNMHHSDTKKKIKKVKTTKGYKVL